MAPRITAEKIMAIAIKLPDNIMACGTVSIGIDLINTTNTSMFYPPFFFRFLNLLNHSMSDIIARTSSTIHDWIISISVLKLPVLLVPLSYRLYRMQTHLLLYT